MKLFTFLSSALLYSVSYAKNIPLENISSPGGELTYYIMGEEQRNDDEEYEGGKSIESMNHRTGEKIVLVTTKIDKDPEKFLYYLSGIKLSKNSKTLYFHSLAWTTSYAIHSIDLETNKSKFITDGFLICIVSGGKYQDNLIIRQHRYFIPVGSYDHYYLYNKNGEYIGLIADSDLTELEMLKKCESLG
ncbi:TPA: hypothetical protein PC537_000974 [Morganella morganii]|nr:hypothetical protein [Morganella morganii]